MFGLFLTSLAGTVRFDLEPLRRPRVGQAAGPVPKLVPPAQAVPGANPPDSLGPSLLQIKSNLVPGLPAFRGHFRGPDPLSEPMPMSRCLAAGGWPEGSQAGPTRLDFIWSGDGLKLSGGLARHQSSEPGHTKSCGGPAAWPIQGRLRGSKSNRAAPATGTKKSQNVGKPGWNRPTPEKAAPTRPRGVSPAPSYREHPLNRSFPRLNPCERTVRAGITWTAQPVGKGCASGVTPGLGGAGVPCCEPRPTLPPRLVNRFTHSRDSL
jgi:hypothetical protein